MRFRKRDNMFLSSNLGVVILRGFEVQREIGRLKSAVIDKQIRDGLFSLVFDMVRLRDGWDIVEVEEHRQRETLEVFCHCGICGRF